MIKIILIFIFGLIETYLFTSWNLAANQKKAYLSSILMFLYMTTYLFILDIAFKDSNSKLVIIVYALACMFGNFFRVKYEKNKNGNHKVI